MIEDQGSSRDLRPGAAAATPKSAAPDLATVMRAIYDSEIGCGLESFWDEGWTVWIGDRMNGRYREAMFDKADFDAIPAWLLTSVDELIGEWKRGRAAEEARASFRLHVARR